MQCYKFGLCVKIQTVAKSLLRRSSKAFLKTFKFGSRNNYAPFKHQIAKDYIPFPICLNVLEISQLASTSYLILGVWHKGSRMLKWHQRYDERP